MRQGSAALGHVACTRTAPSCGAAHTIRNRARARRSTVCHNSRRTRRCRSTYRRCSAPKSERWQEHSLAAARAQRPCTCAYQTHQLPARNSTADASQKKPRVRRRRSRLRQRRCPTALAILAGRRGRTIMYHLVWGARSKSSVTCARGVATRGTPLFYTESTTPLLRTPHLHKDQRRGTHFH